MDTSNRTLGRASWVVAAVAVLVTLGACSSSGGGGTSPTTPAGGTSGSTTSSGGGNTTSSSASTVTIGEVTDFSGVASSYGVPENQGAQIAVDQINAAGGLSGLGGAQLAIKKYDTASSPDNGPTQASAAVADKVAAVFGGEISDTVLAGINVTQRAGVAWLDAGGTADAIHERGYSTVFQVAKDSTQFSQGWFDTAKLAAQQLGIAHPTMAIAYSESSYGQDFLDAFDKINSSGTFKVVSKFSYPLTTTDFSSVAARLANAHADIIFDIGYPADGLNLAKLFATKFHTGAKVYIAGGSDAADVISQLKSQANGTLVLGDVSPTTPGVSKAFKTFYSQYQSKYHAIPNAQALFGYECVQFIAAALDKAKSSTPSDVVNALKTVTLTQTSGNIFPSPATLSFATDGSLDAAPFYATQVVDGGPKLVFPTALGQAKIQPY